jgi:lipopolysaccharide transport system ATP-binding protein
LEVGTGFHPDLTGRENIFLNGAILGMRKKEIARKLDSIIDFSGIGSFIDTPVRRYSSGMYVRLAFSVAAHLESEILILDEVLSVGDFEFQKKCTDKMNELKNAEGKTIILVSHNIDAIRTFCKKSLFLENGRLKMFDETNLVADAYMRVHHEGFEYKTNLVEIKFQSKSFDIINFGIRNGECPPFDKPISRDKSIRFEFNYIKKTVAENNFVVFKYKDIEGNYICTMDSYNQLLIDKQGEGRVVMKTHPFFFNTGKYRVDLFIHGIFEDGVRPIFEQRDILNFEVVASTMLFSENLGVDEGYLHPVTNWRIEENNQV